MKFLSRIPRYSLLWLSPDDVVTVRNRFISLFLKPGEFVALAPPMGFFGITDIRVYPGISPKITFMDGDAAFSFWLKIPSGRLPAWDFTYSGDKEILEPQRVPFNDPLARLPAQIVKGLSVYFPFVPSSNYFLKNGEFIA